ncbi:cytochrome b6-f complex subunit PetL [Synechococcus elongatus]|uniref:Cytochrome b6-f complex subunit PetL n=2 Tax=Synechococcus elongatus TaxID=32046 RepID=A0AAN1UTM8_SYNEL|nr:cytochrome b6-f complex subunit PetL [Synechococcus elongatus]AZB71734.1 cytochrome B6 [Synechococcus elongatus PCC 11801]QFZ91414.1 cytochrome b6-f complex subunit PetL [Synechococcus elongatus PCC 11802]
MGVVFFGLVLGGGIVTAIALLFGLRAVKLI